MKGDREGVCIWRFADRIHWAGLPVIGDAKQGVAMGHQFCKGGKTS